jgi:hypothetical protein
MKLISPLREQLVAKLPTIVDFSKVIIAGTRKQLKLSS